MLDQEFAKMIIANSPAVAILLYIAFRQQAIISKIIDSCLSHLEKDQQNEIERMAKLK
jgi:hypothetical protein